jgi:hypothetical protein
MQISATNEPTNFFDKKHNDKKYEADWSDQYVKPIDERLIVKMLNLCTACEKPPGYGGW